MIELVQTVGPELGIVAACAALGLARATYYRKLEPPMLGPAPKRLSPRALTADEKKAVLAVEKAQARRPVPLWTPHASIACRAHTRGQPVTHHAAPSKSWL